MFSVQDLKANLSSPGEGGMKKMISGPLIHTPLVCIKRWSDILIRTILILILFPCTRF